jgi:hypothetical protein
MIFGHQRNDDGVGFAQRDCNRGMPIPRLFNTAHGTQPIRMQHVFVIIDSG